MPTTMQIRRRDAAEALSCSLAVIASSAPPGLAEMAAAVASLCAAEITAADQSRARAVLLETAATTNRRPGGVPHESARAAAVLQMRRLHGGLLLADDAAANVQAAADALAAMRTLWGQRRGPVARLLAAPVSR
jgi:hypothetical protein